MAKCKIEFNVEANVDAKELFICGNIKELGAWNEAKALKLVYNEETNKFSASKMLELDTFVEYKVMLTASWDHVEKGEWNSEIENHKFTVSKGHKELVNVKYFQ